MRLRRDQLRGGLLRRHHLQPEHFLDPRAERDRMHDVHPISADHCTAGGSACASCAPPTSCTAQHCM